MIKQNDMPDFLPFKSGNMELESCMKYELVDEKGGVHPAYYDGRFFRYTDKREGTVDTRLIKWIRSVERADKPADNGGENCPDGMSCSGNGMDCVGDGFCKGPEVRETSTERMSGEVDIATLKDEVINYINSVYMNPISVASGSAVETAISYLASRNLLKSEGVCVPGEIIEKVADALAYSIPIISKWCNTQGNCIEHHVETRKPVLEALEALRPFLPAEKGE